MHYRSSSASPNFKETDVQTLLAKVAARRASDEESHSAAPFQHPPRAQRASKKLPFSGDFMTFPKALFPWSPESGGRPWDAWTESHKKRLVFVAAVHLGALAAPF